MFWALLILINAVTMGLAAFTYDDPSLWFGTFALVCIAIHYMIEEIN